MTFPASLKTSTLALLLALATKVINIAADNAVIEEPSCDSSKSVSIRYASTTKRLYVEASTAGARGGCATLTDIFDARDGKGPLYPVNPSTGARVSSPTGTWLLTEELYVEDGITLNVSPGYHGMCAQADCIEISKVWLLYTS